MYTFFVENADWPKLKNILIDCQGVEYYRHLADDLLSQAKGQEMRFQTIDDLPEQHRADAAAQLQERKTAEDESASEHDEQVRLIQWAKLQEVRFPVLRWMYAIPNGGQRYTLTAVRLKAEGVRAGVPDLHLPARSGKGRYIGLWLEMKVGKNKPTDSQNEWIMALTALGHYCAVCYSANEAMDVITQYLTGGLE